MMNIVILDSEDWERERFARLADEHDLTLHAEPLTPGNAGEHGRTAGRIRHRQLACPGW